MSTVAGRHTFGDRVRALILKVAIKIGSDKDWWSGYRVTVEKMREGNVGLAMSVLFRPFEEMDLSKPYASPPEGSYFPRLMEDMEAVEAEVGGYDPSEVRLVSDRGSLEACLSAGATALVHCVEGGFHLGDTREEIEANSATLASRGVTYVTVAHLFFRQVATNANALPFLPDPIYSFVFPQHGSDRLTSRGEDVVRGLIRNRILIDLSHMDPGGIAEVFKLLDEELDPNCEMPVVSTHAGYRFGGQQYMHDEETLLKIKERDGVVGLIMAQHQLNDGIRRSHTTTLEESLEVIYRHIDRIAEITGSLRHIALGTDFDGFIKPTMGGLETMADLSLLEAKLHERYGDDAELVCSENALRVLRKLWPEAGSPPA
jgi:microsomal dipeptidase-like Zn-dependent dipeptidase